MKEYCQICNFFKEDAIKRKHPYLEAKGINWNITLCDVCYQGLRLRKTKMKDWINQIVSVPYTVKGPENKIEDTLHLTITMIESVELSNCTFESKLHLGYVWGKLIFYDYGHRERSLLGWKPVTVITTPSVSRSLNFVTDNGKQLISAARFLLHNRKGYIQ